MKPVIAVNTHETIIRSPLYIPEVAAEYRRLYEGKPAQNKGEEISRAMAIQKFLRLPDQFLSPTIPDFLKQMPEQGFSFVVYSGATEEQTERLYRRLPIGDECAWDYVEGAFSATGKNRRNPETFREVGEEMRKRGFEPAAYLTHNLPDAQAAAQAWGKALLCTPEKTENASIYTFGWQNVDERKVVEIAQFLRQKT